MMKACQRPASSLFSRRAPAACRPLQRAHAHVQVKASWGAPVDFSKGKVVANKQVFPGMHQVVVDVGQAVAAGYTKPGQYIQAKVTPDAKPGFFAIASAPGQQSLAPGTLELLIKNQPGATAEAIVGLGAGGEVLVSPAQGKGFPVDKIPAADVDYVLMFATGSGVSPIKAVIDSGVLQPKHRKLVQLFYGTRSRDTTAYQDQISSWGSQGVKVSQVLSVDDKQYVQSALEKQLKGGLIPAGSEARVGVLLCGHRAMAEAVTALLVERGVKKELILSNF